MIPDRCPDVSLGYTSIGHTLSSRCTSDTSPLPGTSPPWRGQPIQYLAPPRPGGPPVQNGSPDPPSTVPAWQYSPLCAGAPGPSQTHGHPRGGQDPGFGLSLFSVRLGGSKPGNHARRRTLAISPLAPAKRGDHLELVVHPADPRRAPHRLSTTAGPRTGTSATSSRAASVELSQESTVTQWTCIHSRFHSCMHESLLAGRMIAGVAGSRCMNECIVSFIHSFIHSVLPSCIHSRNRSCYHA